MGVDMDARRRAAPFPSVGVNGARPSFPRRGVVQAGARLTFSVSSAAPCRSRAAALGEARAVNHETWRSMRWPAALPRTTTLPHTLGPSHLRK